MQSKEHIVCTPMQGWKRHYALCEEIVCTINAPVIDDHRCTVEQFAILKPALFETIAITMRIARRVAYDDAVRRGAPQKAAFDFLTGRLNIVLSTAAFIVFPESKFSDEGLPERRPVIRQRDLQNGLIDGVSR